MVLLETRGEFWDRLLAASQGASVADFSALPPEEFVQQARARALGQLSAMLPAVSMWLTAR